MFYIWAPKLIKCTKKSDLEIVNQLRPLLERNGFVLAKFTVDRVSFYRRSELTENGGVPIHSWYDMGRKEFQVIVELMTKTERGSDE